MDYSLSSWRGLLTSLRAGPFEARAFLGEDEHRSSTEHGAQSPMVDHNPLGMALPDSKLRGRVLLPQFSFHSSFIAGCELETGQSISNVIYITGAERASWNCLC